MRLNTVDPLIVTPTEVRPDVGQPRAIQPVRAYSPNEREPAAPAVPPRQEEGEPAESPDVERRRRSDRRGTDRRKQQIPVLIDTRIGDRRTAARRTEDPGPAHIDIEA